MRLYIEQVSPHTYLLLIRIIVLIDCVVLETINFILFTRYVLIFGLCLKILFVCNSILAKKRLRRIINYFKDLNFNIGKINIVIFYPNYFILY